MQGLDLNLASRPFKNDTLPWVGFGVGLVLLGALTFWNVQSFVETSRLRTDLQEDVAGIKARMDDLDARDREALREVDAYDLGVLAVKSTKANEVIRWKAFSWTRLFNRLQEIQPWDVQMTAIRPVFNVARKSGDERAFEDTEAVPVSVEGLAKTPDDFWKLQAALIFDDHFARVEPENTTIDTVTGETVFRLRFMYDPRVLAGDDVEPEQTLAEAETQSDADDTEEAGEADAEEDAELVADDDAQAGEEPDVLAALAGRDSEEGAPGEDDPETDALPAAEVEDPPAAAEDSDSSDSDRKAEERAAAEALAEQERLLAEQRDAAARREARTDRTRQGAERPDRGRTNRARPKGGGTTKPRARSGGRGR